MADAPPISDYGFDESLTNFEGMGPKLLPLTLKPGQDPNKPGRIWGHAEVLGKGVKWMQRSKITEGFVDAAIPFIKKQKRTITPSTSISGRMMFTLHSGHPWINGGMDRNDSSFFPYSKKWTANWASYSIIFIMIPTLPITPSFSPVPITAQNREPGWPVPFRGYKTHLFEGGIRSSLVAWAPKLMANKAKGTVNQKSIFSAIDLVPTLLDITGTKVPKNVKFDGESLPDVLLGKSNSSRKQDILFRRPPDRDSFYGVEDLPDLAIRSGKWKLLCEYDGSDALLYDLNKDRSEKNNLASKHPKVVKKLSQKVMVWHESMPPDNGPQMIGNSKKK